MKTNQPESKELLVRNLAEFGLTREEALTYIELTRSGSATSYHLHQLTGIGRSTLDKVLDVLLEKNLVSLNRTDNTKIYTAHPYKNLSNLVEVKEAEVEMMKESLNKIYDKFAGLSPGSTKDNAQVIHYYGMEGLKQVVWNALRAKDEMRIFEVSRLSAFMQKKFAERYREECVARGIKHYDLTNESFMPGWTDVHKFVEQDETRYIDPAILEIKFEIYIYNDVVALTDYRNSELLCLEIHNSFLASLQKQLFDYIWKDAKKMVVTGPRGEMTVVKE